jgi:hypothetical protein
MAENGTVPLANKVWQFNLDFVRFPKGCIEGFRIYITLKVEKIFILRTKLAHGNILNTL